MKKSPESIYKERILIQNQKIDKIKKIEIVLIFLKLAAVVTGIVVLYYITMHYRETQLLFLLAVMLVFAFFSLIHEHFINRRIYLKTLISINEGEIKALGHKFPDRDQGEAFADINHNFASDLDLFGEKSVFHFINRAETSLGKSCLADWLKAIPEIERAEQIEILQKAVQELENELDLRQSIQVLGRLMKDSIRNSLEINHLFDEQDSVSQRKVLLYAIHILPVVTIILTVLIFFGLPWWIPVISLSVQILTNRYCTKKHSRIFTLTSRLSTILKAYSKILATIESSEFASRELCDMKQKLIYANRKASSHIRRLSMIMSLFELRRNEILHPVFNSLFLWDLHCVYRIEKWKHKLSSQLEKWLGVIGRFEALSTLACLHFNCPDWSFPKIQAGSFILEAKKLGHFLIHPEERVDNDIILKEEGNLLIITGPNMAGKSTFLKTVGVNLVLAFCGGPVCADEFIVTPVKIYTSMKVSDSLDKNLSLFYAELQRLKMVLDAIKRKEKVFFLLDEMLKGTNALDRQMGAVALLKQLVRLKANGLVATHDLELTKLEKQYPDKVRNFHFDGYVEGDKLLFDYKIKEGRCESFNALLLMKKIGIDIP
ncbi:MAG: hypothetical protein JW755_08930 [Candidatus Aminicenantes bacterium]|nr:hypothetical protein [Candidatus Aminicenantes bacterium]